MANHDCLIRVGSWVEVRDGELLEGWRIVSADEADAGQRLISADCPLARALLGHHAGDRVSVRGPQEAREVTILDVG